MAEMMTSKITTAQELAGKDFAEFTRDDFITHYYSLVGISRSAFDDHKRDAKAYLESKNAFEALDALSTITYYEVPHSNPMENEFFADFNDFFDSLIERVNNLSIKVDESIFDAQVATLLLAWAGVTPEDAAEVKKSDVNEHSRTVIAGGKTYRVPAAGMELLVRYARANRIIKPNNKGLCEMFLRESEYLFRTFKADKMTVHSLLSDVTTKLNILDGKKFHYGNVRLSGVFSRVMQYENEFGAIRMPPRGSSEEIKNAFLEEMGRVFEQNIANEMILKQRLTQYKAYKNYYHKKK